MTDRLRLYGGIINTGAGDMDLIAQIEAATSVPSIEAKKIKVRSASDMTITVNGEAWTCKAYLNGAVYELDLTDVVIESFAVQEAAIDVYIAIEF